VCTQQVDRPGSLEDLPQPPRTPPGYPAAAHANQPARKTPCLSLPVSERAADLARGYLGRDSRNGAGRGGRDREADVGAAPKPVAECRARGGEGVRGHQPAGGPASRWAGSADSVPRTGRGARGRNDGNRDGRGLVVRKAAHLRE
jgi:hypothetical protein